MKQRDDLDQLLSTWLDDPYTPPAPRYLGQVLERTRRTRQRPAWTSLERWLPMADKITRPAAGPLRMAWFVLIVLVLVALGVGAAVVGSRLLKSTGPDNGSNGALAIPQGGAAVLAFDFDSGVPGGPPAGIYTSRADGVGLRQLTTEADIGSRPTWSPDGRRIAYRLLQNGTESIVVMDGGGGNRITVATTAGSPQDCGNGSLAWSPDGTSLIFPTGAACDGRYDLFIVATDGTSPATRLLAPGMNSSDAAWSPDGKQIAFVGRETTGSIGLYVIDVGTGGALRGGLPARLITAAGTNLEWINPRWSPDGTELAAAAGTSSDCIAATSGTMDAVIVKADGSSQRTLAGETAKEYNPTWAPDGRRLAFQRIVDASEDLHGRPCTMATWVVDADGTNAHRLQGLGSDDSQAPLWSPDGTRLTGNTVRVVGDIEHYDLYIVTVDGSSPIVTVDDVGLATWQPLAAPLPPAPSFAVSAAP